MSHHLTLKLLINDHRVDGYPIPSKLLFVFERVLHLHYVRVNLFLRPYSALDKILFLDYKGIYVASMGKLRCISGFLNFRSIFLVIFPRKRFAFRRCERKAVRFYLCAWLVFGLSNQLVRLTRVCEHPGPFTDSNFAGLAADVLKMLASTLLYQ